MTPLRRILPLVLAASVAGPAALQAESVRLAPLPGGTSATAPHPVPDGDGFNASNARDGRPATPRTRVVQKRKLIVPLSVKGSVDTDVVARTEGLRIVAASSVALMVGAFDADEAAAADRAVRVALGPDRELLQSFIGQSRQYVSVAGTDAMVGWWNPISDAWIVSWWTRGPDRWRLKGMDALLGEDLAAGAKAPVGPAPELAWPKASGPLLDTLKKHDQERVAAFKATVRNASLSAILADGSRQDRAWKALVDRQRLQQAMLAQANARQGYANFSGTLRAALAKQGKALGVDQLSSRRLGALPEAVRTTMQPVMVVARKDGLSVLLQSPLAPGLVVATEFQNDAAGGSAKPRSYALASLFAKETP